MAEPFARVAFGDAGLGGEVAGGHGAAFVQRFVKTQSIADPHQRQAERAAEIAKHLADEIVEFRLVEHFVLRERRNRRPSRGAARELSLGMRGAAQISRTADGFGALGAKLS